MLDLIAPCFHLLQALALSSVARGKFTTGEIVNLMSVDTQRIMDYMQVFNLLWVTPLQIGIAIFLLWGQLGVATMGGLAVMILLLPINGVVTAYIRKYQVGIDATIATHSHRSISLCFGDLSRCD